MHDIVKDYYGKQLTQTEDLKTSACCDASSVPEWHRPLLSNIHSDVLSKYYGCGLVAPELLQGCQVLDLGSGSGRDVYALAQLVGPTGHVVGVDMTEEQLDVATRTLDYHAGKFGYRNVSFHKGFIERLHEIPELREGSFDVVVSNCVINLSPDKDAVLAEVYRLLKAGGEFYFSDVYCNRRLPSHLQDHPVLYGECLGGALYWNDFLTLAKKHGFGDPRLVDDRPIEVTDPTLAPLVDGYRFYSATYRLFKIPELESACEDYGQAVIYKGSIPHFPNAFELDSHHCMQTGRVFPVCGNTWRMLHDTRFMEHFEFVGDFSRHFGIFEGCGTALPFGPKESSSSNVPCC